MKFYCHWIFVFLCLKSSEKYQRNNWDWNVSIEGAGISFRYFLLMVLSQCVWETIFRWKCGKCFVQKFLNLVTLIYFLYPSFSCVLKRLTNSVKLALVLAKLFKPLIAVTYIFVPDHHHQVLLLKYLLYVIFLYVELFCVLWKSLYFVYFCQCKNKTLFWMR